jgi:hypothetical protein
MPLINAVINQCETHNVLMNFRGLKGKIDLSNIEETTGKVIIDIAYPKLFLSSFGYEEIRYKTVCFRENLFVQMGNGSREQFDNTNFTEDIYTFDVALIMPSFNPFEAESITVMGITED